ncbi:MAG: hypothetical protein V4736_05430 [Bdellovibrionota bacterium]
MDADNADRLLTELQELSGIEDEGFKDFVREILQASGSPEVKSLDDMRKVLAQYIQKQMGDVLNTSH